MNAAGGTPPGADRAGRRGRLRRWWLAAYLLLLAASHAARLVEIDPAPPARVIFADVPAMRDDAPAGGNTRLAYLRWEPPGIASGSPVILLHGSPGGASDFDRLGPALAAQGRIVLAVDLPGFGWSTEGVAGRSMRTGAHAVLALMERLGIPRAHIVGWSNGGGTGLNIADLAPDRVASLTLMASVGAQATEGSGSYGFEHFKYAVGFLAAWGVRELVPHFGLLDRLDFIEGSMLNFWESDQRPLEGVMSRVRAPTLILHGRDDFLVPAWAAERHHVMMPGSRLVMLPASHFIPFLQVDEATLHLSNFFWEAERGQRPEGEVFDFAPYRNPLGDGGEAADRALRAGPWWASALALALLVVARPVVGVAAAGCFLGRHQIDMGVVIVGLGAGQVLDAACMFLAGITRRRARCPRNAAGRTRTGLPLSPLDWSRRLGVVSGGQRPRPIRLGLASRFRDSPAADAPFAAGLLSAGTGRVWAGVVLGSALWAFVMAPAGSLISARLATHAGLLFEGPWSYGAVFAGWLLSIPILRVVEHLLTWTGRQRLKARITRAVRYEFWPMWAFYLPLVPWFAWLTVRHRGVMTFSCCNPAIEGGGGIIGESKSGILAGLGHCSAVLEGARVDAGPTPRERALAVRRLLDARPGLRGGGPDGFPVILKPDSGQRGHAVRLARDHGSVLAYFQEMTRPAVLQRYHPGPGECGVMWVRNISSLTAQNSHEGNLEVRHERGRPLTGRIFSVTRKEFPIVTGDGEHSLEELILRHRRLRCQWRVFLSRLADQRSEVLAAGEERRLGIAGNHCQGALFLDGADLATPELEEAIDEIARGFPAGKGGGLDFGRFDLRYESDEMLRAGRGFGIVELNGTTSESTNLYDPRRNIFWAYGILFRQWSALFALGAARRRLGVRPLGVGDLFLLLRGFFRKRPGSSISD